MAQGSDSERHRALARRVCVGMLALALVVLQLTGLVHFFLVPHEICAEHGELLHVGASSHAAMAAASDRDEVVLPKAEAEHDHCSVFLHQRVRAVAGPALEVAQFLEGTAPDAAKVAADVPRPIAVLFVAPKSSPPLI